MVTRSEVFVHQANVQTVMCASHNLHRANDVQATSMQLYQDGSHDRSAAGLLYPFAYGCAKTCVCVGVVTAVYMDLFFSLTLRNYSTIADA